MPATTSQPQSSMDVAPTAVLRVPLLPTSAYPAGTDQADPDAAAHVTSLWTDPLFREAVTLASPTLADAADALVAGGSASAKDVANLRRGLLKYAVRATTRCTPFGLFSAVAATGWSTQAPRLGGQPTRHARLGQPVVKKMRLEMEKDVLDRVVTLNPIAREIDGRMVLPFADTTTEEPNTHVDVRLTAALRLVAEQCRTPIPTINLVESLQREFPGVDEETLAKFLDELVHNGILLTELAPSAFDPDPVQRLVDADPRGSLAQAERAREDYEATTPGQGRESLQRLRDLIHAMDPTVEAQRALQVDTTIPLAGGAPEQLHELAPALVDLLTRTTVIPAYDPELDAHAQRFIEHFGDVDVPLVEALDASIGIGMPADYPGSEHPAAKTASGQTQQHTRLFADLLERARVSHTDCVELSDEDLAGLAPQHPVPTSIDLFLEIEDGQGEPHFLLGPTGAAFPAGRSTGRFAAEDDELLDHVQRCAAHDLAAHPGHLLLEMEYMPAPSNATNVALAPSVYPARLLLTSTENATSQDRTLDDLLLGVSDGHFYLRDRRSGQPVLVRRSNLLTPTLFSDLARFLDSVSMEGIVRPSWSWGGLESQLSFLPEVSYRGVTLSSARWRVPEQVTTPEAFDRWATQLDLPQHLQVGLMDNRLLLDRHHSAHRELLMRELGEFRWVARAADPTTSGWVRDHDGGARHMCEAVVSVLGNTTATTRAPATKTQYDPHDEQRYLPAGVEWTYLDLYCRPNAQRQVLAALAAAPELPDGAWFFIRYHDGRDHLRLRVRSGAVALAELSAILMPLRRARLVSEWVVRPYTRELERYGGNNTIDVCERLWCIESATIAANPGLAGAAQSSPTGDDTTLERGLGLVEAWLSGWGYDDSRLDALLSMATAGYDIEFAGQTPELRRAVRGLKPAPLPHESHPYFRDLLGPTMQEVVQVLDTHLPAGTAPQLPARQQAELPGSTQDLDDLSDQVRRFGLELSLLHMWCNRLGFGRQEEYQLALAARNRVRARIYRREAGVR